MQLGLSKWRLGLVLGCVLFVGGAPGFSSVSVADEPNAEPMFFPSPPNRPRLQYLAKFSSVLDVSAKSKGFRNFVFGGEDNEGHLVNKPYGVDIYEGAIFVVDIRGNGYGIFDIAKGRSRFVRPRGGGSLQKPINIAIHDDGTRYITDIEREQILVFDAEDRFKNAFGEPGQFRPSDVAIKNDRLYVVDIGHHKIHVLNRKTGETITTFGGAGADEGHLFHPTNVAVSESGSVYVSDTTNFRVQEFDGDGEFLRSFGVAGSRPGNFARPKGIDLDREGRVYVVDAAFENVQIFAPEGGALMFFGGPGQEGWNINMPAAIKIDYDNVEYFEEYAAPGFEIEYLVLVASQFGPNKVVVYGFGSKEE